MEVKQQTTTERLGLALYGSIKVIIVSWRGLIKVIIVSWHHIIRNHLGSSPSVALVAFPPTQKPHYPPARFGSLAETGFLTDFQNKTCLLCEKSFGGDWHPHRLRFGLHASADAALPSVGQDCTATLLLDAAWPLKNRFSILLSLII